MNLRVQKSESLTTFTCVVSAGNPCLAARGGVLWWKRVTMYLEGDVDWQKHTGYEGEGGGSSWIAWRAFGLQLLD